MLDPSFECKKYVSPLPQRADSGLICSALVQTPLPTSVIFPIGEGSGGGCGLVEETSKPQRVRSRPRYGSPQFPQTADCGVLRRRIDMPKRSAPAIPSNFDLGKAYSEIKKLREDVECIGRWSRLRSRQAIEVVGVNCTKNSIGDPRRGRSFLFDGWSCRKPPLPQASVQSRADRIIATRIDL